MQNQSPAVASTYSFPSSSQTRLPSPRLRERLAHVVVLPRYGEAVYWHEPGRFVQQLHGQHGGLSPQEMEIPLVAWVA